MCVLLPGKLVTHASIMYSMCNRVKIRQRVVSSQVGGVGSCSFNRTSAFGTCIQKYVIERYVCLIVFMVIAQTHVQAVATVH